MSTPVPAYAKHRPHLTVREAYAEELAARSARIIAAVHDDDPAVSGRLMDEALALPAPDADTDPARALLTVLAAQVDPRTTARQRLGWVMAGLDGVQSLPPVQASEMTELAAARVTAPAPEQPAAPDDEALIAEVTSGREPLVMLPVALRREAVRRLLVDVGMTPLAIAAHTRCGSTTVYRYVESLDTAAEHGDQRTLVGAA